MMAGDPEGTSGGSIDMLVCPSDLITFTKIIGECICVNPGTIIKANAGGTYASMTLEPYDLSTYVSNFRVLSQYHRL
jgi:hypothetical protein